MRRIIFLFILLISASCTYNELVPICEPDKQVFLVSVQPIIQNNCIACHSESSGRPAILETYEGVIHAINNHSLREEILSLNMPPSGAPTLSQSDINIIKNWIDCE